MLWISIVLLVAAVICFIAFYIGRGKSMARAARGADESKQFKVYSTLCVIASVLAIAGIVLFLVAGGA